MPRTFYTLLQRFVRDKHSSLFWCGEDEKSFPRLTPGFVLVKGRSRRGRNELTLSGFALILVLAHRYIFLKNFVFLFFNIFESLESLTEHACRRQLTLKRWNVAKKPSFSSVTSTSRRLCQYFSIFAKIFRLLGIETKSWEYFGHFVENFCFLCLT